MTCVLPVHTLCRRHSCCGCSAKKRHRIAAKWVDGALRISNVLKSIRAGFNVNVPHDKWHDWAVALLFHACAVRALKLIHGGEGVYEPLVSLGGHLIPGGGWSVMRM